MKKVRKKIGTIPIKDIEQQVQQSTQAAVTQMQQDVTDFINEETAQYPEIGGTFKYLEDPEGRIEVKTDSDNKIISYRDEKGYLHEEVGIKLSREGLTDLEEDLKANGFVGTVGDWTDYISEDGKKPLNLNKPTCAILNLHTDYDLSQLSKEGYVANPPYWPAGVEGETYDIPVEFEFWDMNGNYFKKWSKISGQGQSTMNVNKKNIAIDLFDDDSLDGAFAVKFGDWIACDSFHLKAYYNDVLKANAVVAYEFYEKIIKTRGVNNDYAWKNSTFIDFDSITKDSPGYNSLDDLFTQFEGAKCFPDGFPVIVYQNGNFWGIYSWQIKKDRNNYKHSKGNTNHIHLDGYIYKDYFFDANGDPALIAWNQFEIRNPKPKKKKEGWDFIDMNGNKYNGDDPTEPIGPTSEYWDETNISHVKSYEVKQKIMAFSTAIANITSLRIAYDQNPIEANLEALKTGFNTYFDSNNLIDYLVFSDVFDNWDGFMHNVQWTTWDGIKWYANPYDVDNTLETPPPHGQHQGTHVSRGIDMFYFIENYFTDELNARYAALRDSKLITADVICQMIRTWVVAIGEKNYKAEYNKWSAENYQNSLFRIKKWLDDQLITTDSLYDYNQN